MSKYRVLLDEMLEYHARPLLNDAGIKTDVVRLTTGNLIRLLQANPYVSEKRQGRLFHRRLHRADNYPPEARR